MVGHDLGKRKWLARRRNQVVKSEDPTNLQAQVNLNNSFNKDVNGIKQLCSDFRNKLKMLKN